MTLWGGIKKFVGGVWGDPTAPRATEAERARRECPQGFIIDPATSLSFCISELVLDLETGDLITPDELERRREEGRRTEGLSWDEVDEEWMTPEELHERRRQRRMQRTRGLHEEFFDSTTGQWVTEREYQRRLAERAKLRELVRGTALLPFALPNLAAPEAEKIQLISGVATLGGKPAAVALGGLPTVPPPGQEDTPRQDTPWLDYLKGLPGPERRDEEGAKTQRLVILGAIAAVLTAIVLTRTRG